MAMNLLKTPFTFYLLVFFMLADGTALAGEFSIIPNNIKSHFIDQPVEAFWSPDSLKASLKISYWGEAKDCLQSWEGAQNGPTLITTNNFSSVDFKLTGLINSNFQTQRWSPSGNSPSLCLPTAQANSGPSFTLVNSDPEYGAVGLYTYSGPHSFFNGYSSKGQSESGANQWITGNFVTKRLTKNTGIQAWNNAKDALRIRTIQSFNHINLLNDRQQVKQQIIVSLLNKNCSDMKVGNCQIQYLFNTGLFRHDPNYWNTESAKWWKDTRISKDPAQSGLSVVDGVIFENGEISYYDYYGSKIPMYKSKGNSTAFALENQKNFEVQIQFDYFKSALRVAAQKFKQNPTLAETTDSDIAELFGLKWADPAEWIVLSIMFAQENYNESQDTTSAEIGGHLRSLQVGSAELPYQWSNFILDSSFNNNAIRRQKVEYNSSEDAMLLKEVGSFMEAPVIMGLKRNLSIRMKTGPDQGIVDILANGTLLKTIDLYNSEAQYIDFQLKNILNGNVFVKFVRSKNRNILSSNNLVNLHSFRILDYVSKPKIYFNDSELFKSTGDWYIEGHSGHLILNKNGAFVEVPMDVGQDGQLSIQTMNGPNRGIVDLYVDGKFFQSMNTFDPIYKLKTTAFKLTPGKHLLKALRSHRTSGSDGVIALDFISN